VDEGQAELERLTEVFINLCAVQKLGQETRDPSTSRRMGTLSVISGDSRASNEGGVPYPGMKSPGH